MRRQNDSALRLVLSMTVAAGLLVMVASATSSPVRSHNNAVSFVSRNLRRGTSDAVSGEMDGSRTAVMGRAVLQGQSIYMNTAIPGEIWALKANTDTNKWTWEHAGQVYSPVDPGAPMNNNPRMMRNPGDGLDNPDNLLVPMNPPAPAPPPVAAPPPAAPAAPAPAPPSCAMIIAEAEKTKGLKGMFLGCQEFRYYGGPSILGKTQPMGCHCASWTVNCPFETCPIGTAFDDRCLSATVKKMGFTSLSKLSNFISPASVPKDLRPYTVHPDYISTCMYWLPTPSNAGLPAINHVAYKSTLPDFGTLFFDSIDIRTCGDQVADMDRLEMTKKHLIEALGEKDISVISITCGSMSALVTGPKEQLDRAADKAKYAHFCWFAATAQVCTVTPPPTPAPPPMPFFALPPGYAPAPGFAGPAGAPFGMPFMPFAIGAPAPAPGMAPSMLLPVFVPMMPMAVAPAAAFALAPAPVLPVFALAPAMAGAPGGPGGPAPAPFR